MSKLLQKNKVSSLEPLSTVVQLSKEVQSKTKVVINPSVLEQTVCLVSQKEGHDLKPSTKRKKIGVGSCIKSRFELLEVLGIGGMGVVYRAQDLRQKELGEKNPYIALKLLNDELSNNDSAMAALQQECKKTQLLSHQNVVNAYDFDRDGESVYITMECLNGKSLDKIIYQPGFKGMSLEEIQSWIKAMAEALAFAHQNNIVHSDLKPSNIFITDNNKIKIFDFGIARALGASNPSQKSDGLSALTPAFASLGMLNNEETKTNDDLYSFVIVIYLLLTGRHPYDSKDARTVISEKIIPRKPNALAENSWKVIELALHPEKSKDLSVVDFMARLFPEKRRLSKYSQWASGVAIGICLLIAGYYCQYDWENSQLILKLSSSDQNKVELALEELRGYSKQRQISILTSARDTLIANTLLLSQERMENMQLSEALVYCEKLLEYFSDSQLLWDLRARLKKQISTVESTTVQAILDDERFLLSDIERVGEEWFQGLGVLKKVNPRHPLLFETRVFEKVVTMVHASLYRGRIDRAKIFVGSFIMLFADTNKKENLNSLISGYEVSEPFRVIDESVDTGLKPTRDWSVELLTLVQSLRENEEISIPKVKKVFLEINAQDKEYSEALQWSMLAHFDENATNMNETTSSQHKHWLRELSP